jgi:3-dehydroquinate synthetase
MPLDRHLHRSSRPVIVLIGPSGAGKSTVGRRLAEMRAERFHDVDELIEERSGRTIDQIFAGGGEREFRRLEWNEIIELSDSHEPCVVALGGGAIEDPAVRQLVRETGVRVFLDIAGIEAVGRLAFDKARPLIAGDDARARWQRLYARRHASYADADVTVDAAPPVDDVARAIDEQLRSIDRPAWRVERDIHGERTEVACYRSLLYMLAAVRSHVGDRHSVIVVDRAIAAEYGELIADRSRGLGSFVTLEGGSSAKSFESTERLVRTFASAGLSREDVVVAIGGGVVSDVAGFAASIYMRGIEALYVPTTLLAQVDAAIGGKTALDAAGNRNLDGTVRQPRGVFICPAFLRSLSARERASGFVEAVKMGIANSDELAHAVDRAAPLVVDGEIPADIEEIVRLSVSTKLDVVERDAYDASVRLSLNLGHTFGHALEASEPERHAHGEAVAFGIAAAAEAALELGVISVARRDEILRRVLPFAEPVGAQHDADAIARAMFTDKKRTGSALRLVLPAETTGVVIHETNDRDLLVRSMSAALERIGA